MQIERTGKGQGQAEREMVPNRITGYIMCFSTVQIAVKTEMPCERLPDKHF